MASERLVVTRAATAAASPLHHVDGTSPHHEHSQRQTTTGTPPSDGSSSSSFLKTIMVPSIGKRKVPSASPLPSLPPRPLSARFSKRRCNLWVFLLVLSFVMCIALVFLSTTLRIDFEFSPVTRETGGAINSRRDNSVSFFAPLRIDKQRQQQEQGTKNRNDKTTVTIAYAISLIKCGDFQSSVVGMVDAALVLRHSVHQNSIRNPASGSKYDYKMYAIVHKDAEKCSDVLRQVGFEIVLVPAPIDLPDIRGGFLRMHIQEEWCCGHDEFIKLFAYTLPEPVFVHTDVDFVFHQPMDDVFDVILYEKDSPEGKAARARIPIERPENNTWPDRVDALFTRDWPQVVPGRKSLFQAGFIVARRDPGVLEDLVDIVKEGNFVPGFERTNGWGGKGYGRSVGAMAMQGLIAYYYDEIRPNTWMELNQCRFNHMGMDVRYRSNPSFRPRHPKVGMCRNDAANCEDCMVTPLDQIYSIHYTQCRKPWNCMAEGNRNSAYKLAIDEDSVHLDHCMELQSVWHNHRRDLERGLLDLTGDETILNGHAGTFLTNVFQGHCTGSGSQHYLPISGRSETFARLAELYQAPSSSFSNAVTASSKL